MSKAHVYKRDHINTDEIIPARYLNTDDTAELASHCMEDLDIGFVKKCNPGDVIVAGDDFGCGSSREHAVIAPMWLGLAGVVARSIARIHRDNLIQWGLLPLEFVTSGDYDGIDQGDDLGLDGLDRIVGGENLLVLRNVTKESDIRITLTVSETEIAMLKAGGALPLLRR